MFVLKKIEIIGGIPYMLNKISVDLDQKNNDCSSSQEFLLIFEILLL